MPPENFTINNHSFVTLTVPFKVILRRFKFVLLISGVRMLHFSNDW